MANCNIQRNREGRIQSVTAPNGKPSILYQSILESLPEKIEMDNYISLALREGMIKDVSREEIAAAIWSKVYTREFKNSFGDWENNPENASKVVDKNGEPLLVIHGTGAKFSVFDPLKRGETTGRSVDNSFDSEHAFFFTDNEDVAFNYAIMARQQEIDEIYSLLSNITLSFNDAEKRSTSYNILRTKYPIFADKIDALKKEGKSNAQIMEVVRDYAKRYSKVYPLTKGGAISNPRSYYRKSRKILNNIKSKKDIIINANKSEVASIIESISGYDMIRLSDGTYDMLYILEDGTIRGKYKLDSRLEALQGKNITSLSENEFNTLISIMQNAIERGESGVNADIKRGGFTPNLMLGFLNIKNPLYHDSNSEPFVMQEDGRGEANNISRVVISAANSSNNDGVIIYNIKDPNLANNYAIFDSNQFKSIFNDGEFSLESNDVYHQMESQEVQEINPNLETVLKETLESVGVKIEELDHIKDRDGNKIGVFGKADLLNQVIQITKDRRTDTLAEESAHMMLGLLGKDHPLVKQMMNRIPEYQVYEDVKREYSEVYNSEEDFRFEAVGKLVSQHIVNNQPLPAQQREFVNDWWSRLIRMISNLFSNKNTSRLSDEVDIFKKAAEDMVSGRMRDVILNSTEAGKIQKLRNIAQKYNMGVTGTISSTVVKADLQKDISSIPGLGIVENESGTYSITDNGKKINPFKEYFQRKTKPQKEVVDKLISDHNRVSPQKGMMERFGEMVERYIIDGKVWKGRVTDLQDKLFRRGKTQKQIDEIRKAPRSIISSEGGTKMHDMLYAWMTNAVPLKDNLELSSNNQTMPIPKGDSFIKDEYVRELGRSVNWLADQIDQKQRAIDPDGKATVLLENTILDEVNETAGSVDVLVMYSDGSASIYDYKFIGFTKEKINGKWQVAKDTQISFVKEEAYDLQISEYKRILEDVYGVTKFRDTRILPFNTQYKTLNGKIQPVIDEVEGFKVSDKQYLMPYPVAKEMTEDPKINNALKVLFERKKNLITQIKKNYADETKVGTLKLELDKLKKSIISIQVSQDITPLAEAINITLENLGKVTSTVDKDTIGELNEMIVEIKLFQSLYKNILHKIPKEKQAEFDRISTRLMSADEVLAAKLIELLMTYNNKMDIPQRELGMVKSNFAYMSQINHPVFRAAWGLIKEATDDTNKMVEKFIGEVKIEKEALESWARSRGMTLLQAYRALMNDEKNLIGRFSPEFHNKVKENRNEGNSKWFKDNYEYTKEGRKAYEQDLKDYEATLQKVGEDYRNFRLESWKNKNDLTRDSAWLSSYALYKYAELKDESKWYSDRYKSLLRPENDGLKRFYDFYVKSNKMFNQMVPERIDGNFVANIQKDVVDTLAQGGGLLNAIIAGKSDIINSLRVRQNDVMSSYDEDVATIPLLYYDNFKYKDKDGEWVTNVEKKNEDLSSNIVLFAESVFRKHNLSQIQDTIESMKLYLADQQVIDTNEFAKPRKEQGGGFQTKESAKNLQVFTGLTDALVYQKRMQGKDRHFKVGDKVYSINKIVASIMKWMSIKALSFNHISGVGNLVGAYGNAYIKGAGGRFYTRTQMWNAHKLIFDRGEKDLYNHLSEYFKVEKDYWIQEEAAKLSMSALTRNLTADKWFLIQAKGDEFVGNTILIAMMQNYGIDVDGNIEKLSRLPKGSKSLLERVDRSNDKMEIEGLTKEGFIEFRNMVKYVSRQIKGMSSAEDIAMIQTTIWGKALTHFKSWIAPMAAERFGSMEYTEEVKEWEYGRYRSLFSAIVNERFMPNFGKMVLDIVTLGRIKYKGDTATLERQFNEFRSENPDLAQDMTIEQYMELRESTIREAMHEIKTLLAVMILLMAARTDWDDDGKEDYKKNFATRQLYALANRGYLELSFFSNPLSVQEIVKSPLPIMQLFVGFANLGSNTGDEIRDAIFGENDPHDKTGPGYYSIRQLPFATTIANLYDDYVAE